MEDLAIPPGATPKPWVVVVRVKYRRGSPEEHSLVRKLYRVARTPDEAATRALRLPSTEIVLVVEPVPADRVREVYFSRGASQEGGGT